MSAGSSATVSCDIARKWLDLAERRLDHYQDLYRSGRWRHYYASEEDFAVRMLDVINEDKNFAHLACVPTPVTPEQDLPSAA